MTVTDKSFYRVEHLGQTHYFCGGNCKARFSGSEATKPLGMKWTLALLLLLALLAALLCVLADRPGLG